MLILTIFSRPGCHLCDEMKAVVRRVALDVPLTLDEVDISAVPALERQFGHEIPVLWLGSRELARHRMDESRLRALLRAAAGRQH